MIIRDPGQLATLLGGWDRYVNLVEYERDDDTPDAKSDSGLRRFGVDLTGKVPGLDSHRHMRTMMGGHIWYWVHVAPQAEPYVAGLTIDACWRDHDAFVSGLVALPAGVTYADAYRCDPVVLQAALRDILKDLDREMGVHLGRTSSEGIARRS